MLHTKIRADYNKYGMGLQFLYWCNFVYITVFLNLLSYEIADWDDVHQMATLGGLCSRHGVDNSQREGNMEGRAATVITVGIVSAVIAGGRGGRLRGGRWGD